MLEESTPATKEERTPDASHFRVFYHSTREFLLDLSSSERRFWVLVLATGVASGLAADVLVRVLGTVQRWSWPRGQTLLESVRAAPPSRRIEVLALAGVLVSIVSLLRRSKLASHGTAGVIEAIWMRAGRYSLGRALTSGTLAIVVIAMGAPLGREGALIAFGAGFASGLARLARATADQTRILVACGGASGIAAAYNVPLGGALFGLEVFLGSLAFELLGPIVISCATATAVSRVFVENHPAYRIPNYELTTPFELLRIAVVALVLGVAAAAFTRVLEELAALGERVPMKLARLLPVAALTATGAMACAYPEILGNGYDTVNAALLDEVPLGLLFALPLLKLLATGACSAAGVPGGLFTPSLFFGALIGGLAGVVIHALWPTAAPAGAYALIGMTGILAGTTHAAASSVLLLFEMTRDYGVILPLMLTSVISAAVARRLERDSIYTGVLRRRDVQLPEPPRPRWLRETSVGALLRSEFATAPLATRFEEVLLRLLSLPPGEDLYVTAGDGSYRGVIVLDALKGHLPDRAELGFTVAEDLMDEGLVPLQPSASLSEAAAHFGATYLDKLPVVDSEGRLVGTVSKQDVFRRGQA